MIRAGTPQRGLTLVELLVSLALTCVLTIASAQLYETGSASYRTVDEAQAMEDTGRLALDLIGRSVRQAGFRNFTQRDASGAAHTRRAGAGISPGVRGYDNSRTTPVTLNQGDGRTGSDGLNGSDTLALRFHGSSLPNDPAEPDGTVIDCLGIAQRTPVSETDIGLSLFAVDIGSSGEPELRCTSAGKPSSRKRQTQPIALGVESFQVAYGSDTDGDGLPETWSDATGVAAWSRVAAVRVGLVVRGSPGSAQGTQAARLHPLGESFGTAFNAPADGRLRRVFTASWQLRNAQE
ncbi:MAG: PilW family protein [Burkholderiaceae bacterium]